MDKDNKSVLVPIIFFSYYNWPLTLKEIRRYLWQGELALDRIEDIIKSFPLTYREGKVWLGDFADQRDSREKLVQQFWHKVSQWRWIFANVPFLSQVFVSNTLAFGAINNESDIDLFLIGKTNRLWTMRAGLLMWFNLFNLRVRSPQRRAKFSPEFFISDSALNLQSFTLDNDYYFNFWLADLISIWPNDNSGEFRSANNWCKDNLPIAWRSPKHKTFLPLKNSIFKLSLEKLLAGRWGDGLERKLKFRQQQIIQHSHQRLGVNPSVVINDNVIKLHFNDRRQQIKEMIEQTLNQLIND